MKRSDSRERGFTLRSHSMASASHYLFKSTKWQPHRLSRSLAGSQMSLADPSMASTMSLDNLTDSPQAGGYFRQPPSQQQIWNNNSSSTLSLDLAADRLTFSVSSPLLSSVGSHHHGSAPDLRSPESEVPISPSPPPSTKSKSRLQLKLHITYFSLLFDQLPSRRFQPLSRLKLKNLPFHHHPSS